MAAILLSEHTATFPSLPTEVLEFIFSYRFLEHEDLLRSSQTCKRLFFVLQGNEIWKIKISQRWFFVKLHSIEDEKAADSFKQYFMLEKKLLRLLRKLCHVTYQCDGISKSDFGDIVQLFGEDLLNLKFILNYLSCLLNRRDTGDDINLRYIAEKTYSYLYHYYLEIKWKEMYYMNISTWKRLEKGAVMISKWCNLKSKIKYKDISKQLDDIALMIREKLPTNIDTGSHQSVKKTLMAINTVLFDEIGFKGNSSNYYAIENSFIDQVLRCKTGIPISLSSLYMCIAHRLGLNLNGINFPGHFLMQCCMETTNADKIYVDAFNKGLFLTEEECLQKYLFDPWMPTAVINRAFQIADDSKIFARMVTNIIAIMRRNAGIDTSHLDKLQSVLELKLLIEPNDEQARLLLARIYLHFGINLEEVVSHLEGMMSSNHGLPEHVLDSLLQHAAEKKVERVKNSQPEYRSHENEAVEYRIGMVMKHRRYNYYCVIYGWDSYCKMEESWKLQMNIASLRYKDEQPFYHVLADDESCRYASQENLAPVDTSRVITHSEVGKHFHKFDGYYYHGVQLLLDQYPDDQPIPEDQLPANKCGQT